jgi:nucleoid DNA-binding protein
MKSKRNLRYYAKVISQDKDLPKNMTRKEVNTILRGLFKNIANAFKAGQDVRVNNYISFSTDKEYELKYHNDKKNGKQKN